MVWLSAFITSLSYMGAFVQGRVISYPYPSSFYGESEVFSLRVDGRNVPTVSYYAGYDYAQLSIDEGHHAHYKISLDSDETVTSYSITPRQLAIEAKAFGNELHFWTSEAHYLIVKINDLKEFVILVDPRESDVPNIHDDGVYNVLDYDADNTGEAITSGIQDALDAAGENPGSTVYVPQGLYLVGNIIVPSQTSLYLAGGSVLRFTGNPDDYETLYTKSDLHPGTWWIRTAKDSTDIKIYGRGTIDGNGYATRQNLYMADLLVPVGTKNFESDGLLVRDSSFWAVVPIQSQDVTITNIKILNRKDVTQDDGIDAVESDRVYINRAIAIANDDSFSAKTWPYKVGTTVPYPYPPRSQSDVVFDNCLAWTDCFGYKIGQGVYENQDNIQFRNSVVYTAGVGIGIHHLFGNDTASNIVFENIDIEGLHGSVAGFSSWLVFIIQQEDNRGVGPVKHVTVKDVRARAQGTRVGYVQGYNSSILISDVTFSDVFMLDSTSPAETLEEMNILETSYSKDISIDNS